MDDFQARAARKDPNAFAAYILSDEQTGKPIKQAPYHKRIQELITQFDRLVIWGHVGLGKCVVDDTVFVLEDGTPITLGALRSVYKPKTTRVASLDTDTGEVVYLPIDNIRYNGKVPVVTITTDVGHQCTTNLEHPYYVRRAREEGWLPASHVRAGDIVFTFPRLESTSTLWMPEADADALGLLVNLVNDSPRVSPSDDLRAGSIVFAIRRQQGETLIANTLLRINKLCMARGWTAEVVERRHHLEIRISGARPFVKRMGLTYSAERIQRYRQVLVEPRLVSDEPIGLPRQLLASGTATVMVFLAALCYGRVKVGHGRELGRIGKLPTNVERGVHWLLSKCGLPHRVTPRGIVLGRQPTAKLVKQMAKNYPGYYTMVADHVEVHAGTTPLYSAKQDTRSWVPVRVKSVKPAGVQDTWGVEIADGRHSHLTDGLLTHNTQQISIARVLWEVGHNPNLRVVIVQATIGLAEGIVTSLKNHIEHNPKVRKVFPHLRPGDEWTTTQFTVERDGNLKDPTVTAVGAEGNILGRRIDLLIIDDGLTLENTRLDSRRTSFLRWLQSTLFTRLEPGSRVVFIGNAWDEDDAMHYYAKVRTWRAFKFPVRDPKTGRPLWPERWPQERIDAFVEDNPLEAARALDCDASTDLGSRFRKEDIIKSVNQGRGMFGSRNEIYHYTELPRGWVIATGVDLGLKKEIGSDYTAITTWGKSPEGKKVILHIERGRFSYEEIITLIIDNHERYNSYIFVESVAAQRFIVDAVRSQAAHVPVAYFFTAGRGEFGNKHSARFGIESVARDLARGVVVVPAVEGSPPDTEQGVSPNASILFSEARKYSPKTPKMHHGDVLMSAWIGHQALGVATGEINQGHIDIDTKRSAADFYEPAVEEPKVHRPPDEVRRLAMQQVIRELIDVRSWPL